LRKQPPPQIASKVTEIGRIKISVVMYVSDQFVDGKWQLTDYRDCIQRWGFGGDKIKTTKNDLKLHKK